MAEQEQIPSKDLTFKELVKQEYLRCATDPVYFAKKYYYIQHPQKGRMLFNLYPFQEVILKQFHKGDYIIINKSRQLGISTLVSCFSLWLMLFHRDKNILVLATSQDTAKNLITKVRFSYDQLPAWMRLKSTENNKLLLKFTNGSQIQAKAATDNASRSESVTLLVIDEAAFIDNIEKIYTGAQQTLATGGQCIALSSPNGTGNWFYKEFTRAQEKKNSFIPLLLPWTVHPERNQEWRDRQDRELGVKAAAQECDADFITSGESVIDTDVLNYYVKNIARDPLYRRGANAEYSIFEEADYSRSYALIADVARGDGADYSTFHIFDIEACRQVAEFQSQISTKEFANVIHAACVEYNNALCVIENASVGWDVLGRIIDKEYKNIYYSPKLDHTADSSQYLSQYNSGTQNMVPGFSMTQKTRPLVISKLISYMNEYSVEIFSKRCLEEIRTFIYKNGRPQAQNGHNDDLVLPIGVFLFLRETTLMYQKQSEELSRAAVNSIHTVNYSAPAVFNNPYSNDNPYRMNDGHGNFEDLNWLLS